MIRTTEPQIKYMHRSSRSASLSVICHWVEKKLEMNEAPNATIFSFNQVLLGRRGYFNHKSIQEICEFVRLLNKSVI